MVWRRSLNFSLRGVGDSIRNQRSFAGARVFLVLLLRSEKEKLVAGERVVRTRTLAPQCCGQGLGVRRGSVACFSLDLHHEIEVLRSKLRSSESHVTSMEREFVESREYTESEIAKLQDDLARLRDRYDR